MLKLYFHTICVDCVYENRDIEGVILSTYFIFNKINQITQLLKNILFLLIYSYFVK